MFQMGLERDQFAEDMKLSDGSMMKIEKIYPLDATFDTKGNDLLYLLYLTSKERRKERSMLFIS